ncbi:hypothetical protein GCM10027066_35170 [Dyella jejuensis]
MALSLPSGVALDALLTLALPSFDDALDGDALVAGGDDADVSSLPGDSDGLLGAGAAEGVADGAGLDCGRSDKSGTASLGAEMVRAGADGVIAGAMAGVTAMAANCGGWARKVGPSTCCAVRGTLGTANGVTEDCKLTVGAARAGKGTDCKEGEGGAAVDGLGWTAATLGNGMGASVGFSTAICGGVMVNADCAGCVGSANEGSGGIGCVPSGCALRTGSGWNAGGTGCGAGTACRESAGGGNPLDTGCSIGGADGFGKVIGGNGAATGRGFSAATWLVCATTGNCLGAGTGRATATTGAAVDASWVACTICAVLPRCVGPCFFGGTPRIGGGGGGCGLFWIRRTSSELPWGSGGGGGNS